MTRTDEHVRVLPHEIVCRICDRHHPAGTPVLEDYLGWRCVGDCGWTGEA